MKGNDMSPKKQMPQEEMRAEYDFDYAQAVRGKHHRRLLAEGANVVVLDPDVAKAFRGSEAVNDALRALLQLSESTRRLTARTARSTGKRNAF
jgi:ketosteroid isomerase-like protein